jgi:hypothetical protein
MLASVDRPLLPLLLALLVLGGCDAGNGGNTEDDPRFSTSDCTIPSSQLVSGCRGADCIPSIDGVAPGDDRLVDAGAADELAGTNRVIGVLVGGRALAIPHNILWTHEIVNVDEWGGRSFAVTYCPLTGSSLAFDRRAIDGAEFGVSGLLFNNNLVMYDRQEDRSLWPQMNRKANCGPNVGTDLSMIPVVEMRWARWRHLHPDTKVVTDGNGFVRQYPYGDYEQPNTDPLFDMTVDDRRPPKERVLGLPSGGVDGVALPFGELEAGAPVRVVTVAAGGTEKTVFWNREAQSAMAFETASTFSVQDGRIVDNETGSVWSVDGRAVEGPRTGERLTPVNEAYVSFWFAWSFFQPGTTIWTSPA